MGRTVIALGGNSMDNFTGNVNDSTVFLEKSFRTLNKIISENEVVLTYGNGPQIGDIYESSGKKYSIDVSGAMSQGLLSYIICNTYDRIRYETGNSKEIIPVLTRTIVNENKYSMKPVGKYYNKAINSDMVEFPGRGYRSVVPSPEPVDILEKSSILSLMADGYLPLAAGGGGAPVVRSLQYYKGYQGVVDKDLTSSLLGTLIEAETLSIITGTDYVYLNYGSKDPEKLVNVSLDELSQYYNTETFEEGTIKPKIKAALNFLRKGGRKVTISSIDNFYSGGTVITQ